MPSAGMSKSQRMLWTTFFAETTLHGVSHAFDPKAGKRRRYFWRCLVVISFVSVMVLIIISVKKLLEPTITTQIDVSVEESIEFPALTICPDNQFRKSYVKTHPEVIRFLENIFQSRVVAETEEEARAAANISIETINVTRLALEAAHTLPEVVAYAFSPLRSVIKPFNYHSFTQVITEIGVCYTLTDRWSLTAPGMHSGLKLIAGIDPSEYFVGEMSSGSKAVKFSIHAPDDESRISELGRQAAPGQLHDVAIKKRVVSLAIRFLASGSLYSLLSDSQGLDPSTVCRAVDAFVKYMFTVKGRYIKWPKPREHAQAALKWSEITDFPRVLAAVDGTHIALRCPSREDNIYYCRKNFHSLNVMNIYSSLSGCVDTDSPEFVNPLQFYDNYSREACRMECMVKDISKHCGCKHYYWPGDYNICKYQREYRCVKERMLDHQTGNFKNSPAAVCVCKRKCREVSYEVRVSSAPYPTPAFIEFLNRSYYRKLPLDPDLWHERAHFYIYFETLDVTNVREIVTYGFSDFASDLGGTMGLLLGASLMTVAEMMELCLEFLPGCRRTVREKSKHNSSNGSVHKDMIPERIIVTE